jgi:hypothetical protein
MSPLILPMLAHAALVFALYAALTWARARAVARKANDYDAYEFSDGEDKLAMRLSANLSNQFEAPVLFYVAALLLIQLAADRGPGVAAAAWVFVAGRLAHSAVQIFTGDVKLRGLVFTVNFLAIVALWGFIALEAVRAAGALQGGPHGQAARQDPDERGGDPCAL